MCVKTKIEELQAELEELTGMYSNIHISFHNAEKTSATAATKTLADITDLDYAEEGSEESNLKWATAYRLGKPVTFTAFYYDKAQ